MVRWGILGTGKIAADFVCALQHVPDAQVIAVGSRSESSAAAFAARFNIQLSHGSYEGVANNPSVDVIYVATPHSHHADNVRLCLEAGKNVLCEKAFALNATEAEGMIALARARGLFLMENMWTRFFPIVRSLRRIVDEGDIGDVRLVQGNFSFTMPPGIERLIKPELGAGALLDIGIYLVSFASLVYGGTAPVKIVADADMNEHNVDDAVTMSLSYGRGRRAVLWCATNGATESEIRVHGTKGSVRLTHPFWCPTEMIVRRDDLTPGRRETTTVTHALPVCHATYNFTNSVGLSYAAAEVERCLKDGLKESPEMPLGETLQIMKTLDAIRREIGLRYPADGSP